MKEAEIGEVTYSIVDEDGNRTFGIRTYAEAFEFAGRNVCAWVAEHGGMSKVAICKETVVGVVSVQSDSPAEREPSIGEKLSGLVDELVESREMVGADGKAVGTAGRWAGDVCRLIGSAVDLVACVPIDADVGKDVALEADGADEARRVAASLPEGVGGRAGRDGDAPVVVAEVEKRTKRGELLRLLDLFAMEFVTLAVTFYEPRPDGGEVKFECGDLLAAKKRAEALKRLAGAIEELSRSDCDVDQVHDAIIAYCAE